MTSTAKSPSVGPRGPYAYENWKAALAGSQSNGASECPLFTDAHVTGDLTSGYGPYQFFNTVAIGPPGELKPGLVLRMEHHIDEDPADLPMDKTTTERYHGGSLKDELAALLSLSLGIRLKAGGSTRLFEPDGDPKGRPHAWEFHKNPILLKSTGRRPILPNMDRSQSLNDDRLLGTLPQLTPDMANALVRASRQYQDGIWISESEPRLSWIMFVSAVESAADHWRGKNDLPVDRLRDSVPELIPVLERSGGHALVEEVARQLSNRMGAAKIFVDFLLTFLPPPPPVRPPSWAQISWERGDLARSFRKIYDWRSRALHGGTPFPRPMCMEPAFDQGYAERPPGLAAASMGGVWVASDTPMVLHTFEYIVRGALQGWWRSVVGVNGSGTQTIPPAPASWLR